MVVVEFNPWRLPSDDAIFRGFFSMLATAAGASLSTKFERFRGRAGKLAGLGKAPAKLLGNVSKTAETIGELLTRLDEIAVRGDSVALEELRSRLERHLATSTKRIVILVDDVDRLDKSEAHTLFRLVKACANLPNVSYVLAFDDSAVARALGERYGGGDEESGRAFLEKIIQVPLKLPLAAREDLRELCFEQLNAALGSAGVELTEAQAGEFVSGFDRGAAVRMTTPRAAKRFGNGVLFTLPMLKGEVNLVDLLLVEALRAFYPEVYDVARENHVDFSGVERETVGHSQAEPRAVRLLKPIIELMADDEAAGAKALLVDLFPRLSGSYAHGVYGSSSLPQWFQDKRISSPAYCPRYFSYSIPRNDVPDAEVTALFEAARGGNVQAVEDRLDVLLTPLKARRLIEKLRTNEDVVEPVAAQTLAVVLAKLGRKIPNPKGFAYFAEPPSQAAILISHLLRRISDRAARLEVAKTIASNADPLWFGVACLRWLHITDKPEKAESNALTKEEVAKARAVLIGRIKDVAATREPLHGDNYPQEYSVLHEWRRGEGREPVQAYLVSLFENDLDQVTKFLIAHASRSWGANEVVPRVGELRYEHLRNIQLLIDLNVMANWVRRAGKGELDNPATHPDLAKPANERVPENFMYAYNIWKEKGEPAEIKDDDGYED